MSSSSVTWLIVEPTFIGHRFTYLVEIIRGAIVRNIRVVVAVGCDSQGDIIAQRLGATFAGETFSILRLQTPEDRRFFRGRIGLVLRTFGWWRFLFRAYREVARHHHIDFVFVPYLDDALFAISILGSPFRKVWFGGLTMRQRFHLREMGVITKSAVGMRLKRRLFLRVLRLKHLRRVYVIDDTLQEYVAHRYPSFASKLRFVPDPIAPIVIKPKVEARRLLALEGDVLIVLVIGYLDSRKGIARLLAWAAACESKRAVHVVLGGIMSSDVELLMTCESARSLHEQGRLKVFNRYIESDEQQLLLAAADIVWLGYDDVELMSGVLVAAAHFQKAVLFSDYGLIARFARRFGSAPGGASRTPIELPDLPAGIDIRFFDQPSESSEALPDHSWASACRAIFEA